MKRPPRAILALLALTAILTFALAAHTCAHHFAHTGLNPTPATQKATP